MSDPGVLILAQCLAALGNLLTDATLAIKIQAVFACSADAEFRQRQRFFAPWAPFQLNLADFHLSSHFDAPLTFSIRLLENKTSSLADRLAALHPWSVRTLCY